MTGLQNSKVKSLHKVLGKSAIKKGGHFSRGRPFKLLIFNIKPNGQFFDRCHEIRPSFSLFRQSALHRYLTLFCETIITYVIRIDVIHFIKYLIKIVKLSAILCNTYVFLVLSNTYDYNHLHSLLTRFVFADLDCVVRNVVPGLKLLAGWTGYIHLLQINSGARSV